MKEPPNLSLVGVKLYVPGPQKDIIIKNNTFIAQQSSTNIESTESVDIAFSDIREIKSKQEQRQKRIVYRSKSPNDSSFSAKIPPVTNPNYGSTKRIYFARRKISSSAKLLIINFEGVIGDFYTPNALIKDNLGFYLRPNSISSLISLSSIYQLVVFFISEEELSKYALQYLISRCIIIDSAYMSLNYSWENIAHNYDQIYNDYSLTKEASAQVLV